MPSSSGPTRRVRAILIAAIIVVAAAFSAMAPASADPVAPPANASEAVRQLTELNATAFTLTESMYAAQDTLDRRRGELSTAVQFAHETSAAAGEAEVAASANREALAKTAELGQAVYWSRSRQCLWHKGETSGHIQHISEIRLDCDADAIVLRVIQEGGIACHTGRVHCFFRRLTATGWQIVDSVVKDPSDIYPEKP